MKTTNLLITMQSIKLQSTKTSHHPSIYGSHRRNLSILHPPPSWDSSKNNPCHFQLVLSVGTRPVLFRGVSHGGQPVIQKFRTTVSMFLCIVAYDVMVPLLLWHPGYHQRPTHHQRLVVWQLGEICHGILGERAMGRQGLDVFSDPK